jgi:hypothetical protein
MRINTATNHDMVFGSSIKRLQNQRDQLKRQRDYSKEKLDTSYDLENSLKKLNSCYEPSTTYLWNPDCQFNKLRARYNYFIQMMASALAESPIQEDLNLLKRKSG